MFFVYFILWSLFVFPSSMAQLGLSTPINTPNSTMATTTITEIVISPLQNIQVSTSLLFGIPPFGILLYIPLLYLILSNRKKYSNPFYTLVLMVSINDLYWLFYFLYSGSCLALEDCPGGELVNTVVTIAAVYGFYMCMFLNLAIAWNRFSAVFLYKHYERNVFNKRMVVIYILMVHLASGLANLPAFIYHMKYYPELEHHSFVNSPSEEFLKIWKVADLVLSYTLHALIVIMYVAAFISYRRMSFQMYYKQRRNRRFLYQAMLNSVPCLLYINCYHFNIATIELFLAELCMVMNPFVYLWFNTELREDFLMLIHWKKQANEDAHVVPGNTFSSNCPKDNTRPTTPGFSHSHSLEK